MALQLTTVFVALADLSSGALVTFYTQLFNQTPDPYIPKAYAEFHLPGLRLGIFQPKPDHWQEFTGATGGFSLGLEVVDLEAAIAHLHQLGYPPPGDIQTASHGREIYAYDPAGNRLILHESC
jgi:predicted enzyme related to lactoylglutathione lyase